MPRPAKKKKPAPVTAAELGIAGITDSDIQRCYDAPPAPPAASTPPAAAADVSEPTAAAHAASLSVLRAQIADITGRLEISEAMVEALQAKERGTVVGLQVQALQSTITTLRAEAVRKDWLMERLEGFCGVKGVDPKSAILAAKQADLQSPVERYKAAVENNDMPARRELVAKHGAELHAALLARR